MEDTKRLRDGQSTGLQVGGATCSGWVRALFVWVLGFGSTFTFEVSRCSVVLQRTRHALLPDLSS